VDAPRPRVTNELPRQRERESPPAERGWDRYHEMAIVRLGRKSRQESYGDVRSPSNWIVERLLEVKGRGVPVGRERRQHETVLFALLVLSFLLLLILAENRWWSGGGHSDVRNWHSVLATSERTRIFSNVPRSLTILDGPAKVLPTPNLQLPLLLRLSLPRDIHTSLNQP
jgi:hypothetical protein